ncbi:MAG: LysM peptidoglycan-binding domain-containing M23 family metallopeptidase [Anaerolineae bacterium]
MIFSKTNIFTAMLAILAVLCVQVFDISPVDSLDQAELFQSSNIVAQSISNGLSPKLHRAEKPELKPDNVQVLWEITEKLEVVTEHGQPSLSIRQSFGPELTTGMKIEASNKTEIADLTGFLSQSEFSKKFYELQPGDSASRVAKISGMDVDMLRMVNLVRDGESLFAGQTLFIPNSEDLDITFSEELQWPFEYKELPFVISQFFRPEAAHNHDSGHYEPEHVGIDFALPNKSPIRASASGLVTFSGWDPIGYGNMVLIYHGDYLFTLYAHLDSIKVEAGDVINQSSVIGYAGNTGFSSNTHLHFEVIHKFTSLNPCRAIAAGCTPDEYQAN